MRVLNPNLDLDQFFERLSGARKRVLLLDYDGTLAPFHVRPDRTMPYPGVADILKDLVELGSSRVILVTGRQLADMRGPLTHLRHTEVWGAHGWQRCTAEGVRTDFRPANAALRQLQLAETRARRLEMSGLRVEHKVASVAVHWRGMDQDSAASIREKMKIAWQGIEAGELELLEFDGGFELRALGRNKGDAVNEVLSESPADAVCAYLGDDLTDEDAFAAIKNRGLAVLVRPSLRETSADLWITPPEELVEFLRQWRHGGVAN